MNNANVNQPASIRQKLCAALTRYDAQQFARAKRRKNGYYNHYALSLYLERLDDVMRDIANGAGVAEAISAAYTGPLRNACLKALGLPRDDSDSPGVYMGMPVYQPASSWGGR